MFAPPSIPARVHRVHRVGTKQMQAILNAKNAMLAHFRRSELLRVRNVRLTRTLQLRAVLLQIVIATRGSREAMVGHVWHVRQAHTKAPEALHLAHSVISGSTSTPPGLLTWMIVFSAPTIRPLLSAVPV